MQNPLNVIFGRKYDPLVQVTSIVGMIAKKYFRAFEPSYVSSSKQRSILICSIGRVLVDPSTVREGL